MIHRQVGYGCKLQSICAKSRNKFCKKIGNPQQHWQFVVDKMFTSVHNFLNLTNPWLTLTLFIGFGTLLFFLYKKHTKNGRKTWIQVGRVKKLVIYPLKSCQGIQVDKAIAAPVGLKSPTLSYLRDRVFMIMSTDETFQDPEAIPKMASISTQVLTDAIVMMPPNRSPITVRIPQNVPEARRTCKVLSEKLTEVLDCGDEVADWLDDFLGGPGHRLYYHHGTVTQRTVPTAIHKRFNVPVSAKGTFQYETSFMLMATASLDALSEALGYPVAYDSFRPNILVEDTVGAFAEEFWDVIRIGKNGPRFKYWMPCDRCGQININQTEGTISEDREPLKTLFKLQRQVGNNERVNKYCRGKAIMGIHLGLMAEDEDTENSNKERIIRIGDPVYAWM